MEKIDKKFDKLDANLKAIERAIETKNTTIFRVSIGATCLFIGIQTFISIILQNNFQEIAGKD